MKYDVATNATKITIGGETQRLRNNYIPSINQNTLYGANLRDYRKEV